MIETVTEGEFIDRFYSMGRGDQFSTNGLGALYEYLEDYEADTGERVELDVVALCVEYTEYESAWYAMYAYQPEDMPTEGEEGDDLLEVQEKNEAAALEWLEGRTTVIKFDGGVIIQNF